MNFIHLDSSSPVVTICFDRWGKMVFLLGFLGAARSSCRVPLVSRIGNSAFRLCCFLSAYKT